MKKLLSSTLPVLLLTSILSACSTNFASDTTKPTVILNSVAGVTQSGSVTYTATASDESGIKEVDFYLDGNLLNKDTTDPYQTSINWNAVQNGTHTLKAIAIDIYGNSNETAQQINVNIVTDTQKPNVTITTTAPNPITVAGNYTVTIAASDNMGVASLTGQVKTPDGSVVTLPLTTSGGSWTIPVTSSTQNGTYTLTVTATDAAGLSYTTSSSVTVSLPTAAAAPTPTPTPTPTPIDTVKPVVSITSSANPITAPGNYIVTVQATDNVAVTSLTGTVTTPNGQVTPISFGSVNGGSQAIPVLSNTQNGTYTVTATATDAAGNTSNSTLQIVVQLP